MDMIHQLIWSSGSWAPALCLLLFCVASFSVVWRLEVLAGKGVEGTVLGTLLMPLCSGMGNIVFALSLGLRGGAGHDVLVNCLFNNVTNLTLLVGGPVLIWGMVSIPAKGGKRAVQEAMIGRLALSFHLVAAMLFGGIILALGSDGVLSRMDGVVLLVLFAFWQSFHLYDVKKTNLLKRQRYPSSLPLDVMVLLLCAGIVFITTDWLVVWFGSLEHATLPRGMLGWVSGVLMVLPNALLAFYYGSKRRMDVVYTSQMGDAHICIPFCLGLFTLFSPIWTGRSFQLSMYLLIGLSAVHLVCMLIWGRMPRWAALALFLGFGLFMWAGAGL
jgi:cation:H+ antiporter